MLKMNETGDAAVDDVNNFDLDSPDIKRTGDEWTWRKTTEQVFGTIGRVRNAFFDIFVCSLTFQFAMSSGNPKHISKIH